MVESEILSMFLGVGAGGGGVTTAAWWLLKRYIDKRDHDFEILTKELKEKSAAEIHELREGIKTLQQTVPTKTQLISVTTRVVALEKHNIDCPIGTVQADLKNVIGWQKNTSLTLQDVQKTVNALEAHREDDREWMRNISGKLDRLGEK